MSTKYDGIARISVAGGIAAIGLTLGGVAMANAADDTGTESGEAGVAWPAPDREGVVIHRADGPGGAFAADLAEELGVEESKVADALEAARAVLPAPRAASGDRVTPPTDAEREEHEKALAEALAEELDLPVAKVADALAALRAEHEAEHRTHLATRLDEAVEAGDLTAADKASVLKAFDAGVLGPRGGPRG